jgi:hypothetical protein
MKNPVRTMFILALFSEVISSGWTWIRAPSDTLRVGYEGSFLAYEFERLVPWSIAFVVSLLLCTVLGGKRSLS